MFKSSLFILIVLLSGCAKYNMEKSFLGFWEGPHPDNPDKKFYVQVERRNDTLFAKGFWTENSFYQSEFRVDSVNVNQNNISFSVPIWYCNYRGMLTNENHIKGGFECEGEAFDSVQLSKNKQIENFLIYPKPECKAGGYSYQHKTPKYRNDKINVSDFTSRGDSIFVYSILSEIINKEYGRLNSFLIQKDNHLICEEYFYGYNYDDLHQIESCTKSVTSVLVGIALDKGLIKSIDEPLYKIFPEYTHLKTGYYNEITIENLLTMQSGFEPQNNQLFKAENKFDFAINRKLNARPGDTFQYDGGNTEILGAILYRKTGMSVVEFAQKYLFQPLSIKEFNWKDFNGNDFPTMSGSLSLIPRDMIKLGELILNSGWFHGEQLISEHWVKQSTSVKTTTNIPGDNYSYQWWNLQLDSKGKSYDVIWANGWGSQFIYIIPEIDVVIVTTGHNYEYDSWAITEGISKYLYLLDKNDVFVNY